MRYAEMCFFELGNGDSVNGRRHGANDKRKTARILDNIHYPLSDIYKPYAMKRHMEKKKKYATTMGMNRNHMNTTKKRNDNEKPITKHQKLTNINFPPTLTASSS